ncbi:sensor histidine kinase [Dactylosporangium aurantiacum]|uniref:histidine kinase n=1 Tax=Dactylosporangium aurantiacum TaxID=35754 RepID=A0A9Q9IL17_9ACTN|nr:sensor histidine kinase [Dactylosporangium aurantiacum]MDG6100602.1 sensor domain-containing protein [Dactylosporangium aurantiacum]UWZ55309.1 sensor histidine kinase [Dactylosporangium aurantiacum]
MTTTITPRRSGIFRQLAVDTQYVLLGFPLGIVTVVLFLVGFGLGVGLSVTVLGFPILVATLFQARGFATVERARIGPVLRTRLPHPYYKKPDPDDGFWRKMLVPLSDGQSWLDLLHGILRFIPSTIAFAFVLTWWVGALGGVTTILWDWSIPRPPDNKDLNELIGLGSGDDVRILLYTGIGAVFALTLVPVVRGAAQLEAQFARALLNGVNELRERVAEAEAGRDAARAQREAAVSAEATALRRLERDIHDGPQQRLVRLAMDLGRADLQFESDPQAARATVAEALAQTRETLDELRALSRGIAPPILVDRGLRAALTALAGRSPVPVDLDLPKTDDRLAEHVETTTYFVVAEALTNVAKHSGAQECQVRLQRSAYGLLVTVEDDGAGGASLAKGHGLTGLMDRVKAAGGEMTVTSPAGGGTRLTAILPA